MRGYRHLTTAFAKSQLREPVGFFFLIIFPPGLLLLLGLIFGNEPQLEFGGRGFVDNMLPGITVLSLMMVGIMFVPQNQLTLRASGALQRLRATPLRPQTYVAADLTVNAVLGLLGAVLTFTTALVVFDVTPPASVGLVLLACSLGLVAMLTIGYTLAALYPSVAVATGVGNGLMIVLMLTSGAFIPTEAMPDTLQTLMRVSPVHHMAELVKASWAGVAWPIGSIAVLVGVCLVFGALATIFFRWDRGSR